MKPHFSLRLNSGYFIFLAVLMVGATPNVHGNEVPGDSPFVVKDALLKREFARKLAALEREGRLLSARDTQRQLRRAADKEVDIRGRQLARRYEQPPKDLYRSAMPSVLILGTVDQLDAGNGEPYLAQSATAWVLTGDGWCMSNHHVFASSGGWGVSDHEGRVYPVVEILSSNAEADIVLFRVELGEDELKPLAIANNVRVGQPVSVISHPAGQLYFFSAGRVSRIYQQEEGAITSEWMSISADFAIGSSGGPVLNDRCEVVGMATTTLAIQATPSKGEGQEVQMILRDCVPLHVLRKFLLSQ